MSWTLILREDVQEEGSPDTCVEMSGARGEVEAGGGGLKNKHKQSRAGGERRSWRLQFDLGRACPGLPLNAGREPH